jgi:hypothetical protein
VFQRVSQFLFALDQPVPDDLPSMTTRQWAGTLAASALASLNVPRAQGMARFVRNWWPGTPTPEQWAAYFSSKHGTLVDLLTTDSLLPDGGAGVLTDPTVLSRAGIAARGSFIDRQLLCVQIPSPPPDLSTLPPLMSGQTRRAQLETAVAGQPCHACHEQTDPLGFALGNFATDGSYHTTENDLPIVTEATVRLPGGVVTVVQDAQSLGNQLANSCEVAICFTHSLLQDATVSANLPNPASAEEITLIASQFAAAGLSLPELVRLVVESDAFLSAD